MQRDEPRRVLHVQEEPVKAIVMCELRMEGRSEKTILPGRNDMSVWEGSKRLDRWTNCVDARRPDKDCRKRLCAKLGDSKISFEAVELSSERVTPRSDIHESERRLAIRASLGDALCEQDHPGTSAPYRHLTPGALPDRIEQPVGDQQLTDRCTFPSRDDQPVDAFEMLREAHLRDSVSERTYRALVLDVGPLQGQNPNIHTMSV